MVITELLNDAPEPSTTNNSKTNRIEISLLTASLNEVKNIQIWLERISTLYFSNKIKEIKELVIVDDGSKDGTLDEIIKAKKDYPIPIKLIQRNIKTGTLNAQIVGTVSCEYEHVLIMDCDLQHPTEFIPDFIQRLESDPDIIIGSRYVKGGTNDWPAYRGVVSRIATFLSHILLKNSRKIKDPLSGYFLIRKNLLTSLTPYEGMYKPLLFAISMSTTRKVIEIPVRMEQRNYGKSKIVTNPVMVIFRYIREILIFWISVRKKMSRAKQ